LTYLYAHSLYGKDTPKMIQLMEQLAVEHPEFPWPNLALAQAGKYVRVSRPANLQSYIQAFLKLCPKSPEPTPLLGDLEHSDFFTDAIGRMRKNLATRSDMPSLLLYSDLWFMEARMRVTGEEITEIQQTIRDDLTHLRSLEPEPQGELASLIRVGYGIIGDWETSRDLLKKNRSSSGRWSTVSFEIKDWNAQNPVPPGNAPAEQWTAYWESRLRACDSWIKELPESSSLLVLKLEALGALKNHPETGFIEVATKALALERETGERPQASPDLSWGSNILKLASLCAERGVWLDQIPALIDEGLTAAYQSSWENATDLTHDLQWVLLNMRFSYWIKADDVWHSLARAYLLQGKPDKAREALDFIEPGLTEFRSQLAQLQAGPRPYYEELIIGQRTTMANELAARERRLADARGSIAQAGDK
jgi:hypothetical protein